jgi:hypothetical protein
MQVKNIIASGATFKLRVVYSWPPGELRLRISLLPLTLCIIFSCEFNLHFLAMLLTYRMLECRQCIRLPFINYDILLTAKNVLRAYSYPSFLEFNKFIRQLTCGGRTGSTAIYIHTEGMGRILTNIFETNYCR